MLRKSIILLALTTIFASLGIPPAGASHTRTCEDDQTLTGSYQRVLVPEGETCTLDGAEIAGDVLVRAGGNLTAIDAFVGDDLRAKDPDFIAVTGGEIVDDVKVSGTSSNPDGERNYIRDCTIIGGNLRIRFTLETSEGWVIGGGSAVCEGSLADGGVDVTGDADIDDNSSDDDTDTEIEITGNIFRSDLEADRNVVPLSITGNTIGDDLDCDDNTPEPDTQDNTVGDDALDQCSP